MTTPKSLSQVLSEFEPKVDELIKSVGLPVDDDFFVDRESYERMKSIAVMLAKALEFYGDKNSYDREGVCEHDGKEMNDWWVDYGFTAKQALTEASKILGSEVNEI